MSLKALLRADYRPKKHRGRLARPLGPFARFHCPFDPIVESAHEVAS